MKNPQYERPKLINERLNRWGGKPVPKAELLAICGVSVRILKEDIAFLRLEYQASVSYCRREKGYFYASPFDLMAQVSADSERLPDSVNGHSGPWPVQGTTSV